MVIYGIYLLDNDQSAINGVTKEVPWRKNGFDVIGSNTDPNRAVQEIMTLRPVLVIYEWRIGGIALMNRLRAAGVDCDYIILTDCQSLSALRNFFANGGLDYLLKPLDKREAETALAKLRTRRFTAGNYGAVRQEQQRQGGMKL